MEPKTCQNGGGQDGEKNGKSFRHNKKEAGLHSPAPLEPKKWPTWSQLGSQNGAKMNNTSIPKAIIFLMPLGIGFWESFGGFGMPRWSQVGTKSIDKSMLTSKGDFSKIVLWLQRGLDFS